MPAAPARRITALTGVAREGDTVIAVGPRGLIERSGDGGRTWQRVASPVAGDLSTVRFTGPTTAWALGHDCVMLRSDDAGKSWKKVLDGRLVFKALKAAFSNGPDNLAHEVERTARQSATPGVWTAPLLDIAFVDEKTGYAVGGFGLVLRTQDGGNTWSPWMAQVDNPRLFHVYAVATRGADVLLAGEQGTLLRGAGDRFVAVPTPYNGTYFGLAMGERYVLAYGLRGSAYVSADLGASWRQLTLGTEASVVAGWVRGDTALLVLQDGAVVRANLESLAVISRSAASGPETYDAALDRSGETLILAGMKGVRTVIAPERSSAGNGKK